MKKYLLTLVLATSSLTFAQSEGEVAYNSLGCVGCHGVNAVGTAMAPSLAGKKAEYIEQQLREFVIGIRKNNTMIAMARTAIGKEVVIAEWLESLCTKVEK
jgi:cytochrome c553